jgi:membrane protein required for colicin V production
MPILDLFLLLLLSVLAAMGLRSGLIHESVTFVGLVVGLVVAGLFHEPFGVLFVPWLHTRGMSNLAAFLVILVVIWGLMLLLGALLRSLLEGIRLGWLDNLGGMLLGLVKGLFLAQIVVLVLMAMPAENVRGAVMRSWIGRWLAQLAPDLLDLVPPVLRYWQPF